MDRCWHMIAPLVASMAVLFAMGTAGAAESSGGTKVYRWTDEKGVVHYGDTVPSEYTQRERSVLNSQGVEVGHLEGGKNAAQQAEQTRAANAAQQREQHDQFLLSTYLSTKDIEQLRDERLTQVEAQIKATLIYIDTLNARLAALQDRAMRFKPYNSDPGARRMPDELAEELVRTMSESRSQQQALEAKRREAVDTRTQFDGDIQRYRDLTTRPRS